MTSLEINVSRGDEPVDAKSFFTTAGGVIELLQQVERDAERRDHPTRWVVRDLKMGSAVAVAAPEADDMSDVHHARTAGERLVGGARLLAGSPDPPPGFSITALRGILRVAKGCEDGSSIRLSIRHTASDESETSAVLDEAVVRNTEDLLSVRNLEFGSVHGEIDRINVRGGKREVSIFDADQQRSVRATFGDDMLEEVVGSIKHRVAAWGVAQRNALGQTLSFQIEHLERVEEHPIISVSEIAGIAPWWTDDEDPTEWVRRQRAGE